MCFSAVAASGRLASPPPVSEGTQSIVKKTFRPGEDRYSDESIRHIPRYHSTFEFISELARKACVFRKGRGR